MIAYTSTESGRQEVYVRPFAPSGAAAAVSGGQWRVSRDGGAAPRWRADGKELFFRALINGSPMAVDVESTPTFRADIPKRLFAMSTNPPWVPTPDESAVPGRHGSPARHPGTGHHRAQLGIGVEAMKAGSGLFSRRELVKRVGDRTDSPIRFLSHFQPDSSPLLV